MTAGPAERSSLPLRGAERLVAGRGCYLDDVPAPEALHAVFVRSPHAHARVLGIDAREAGGLPGVRGAYALADLERLGAGRLPVGWCVPGQRAVDNDLLASQRVRFAGDPVSVVVAEDAYLAQDAAARVRVEYEPLPAVLDAEAALAAGAPLLHPDWGENVLARVLVEGGDADRAFADAAIVVGGRFHVGRSAGMPLEPRGALARAEPGSDELQLVASVQSPHHVRMDLAEVLGRPESAIRVVPPDVGGSFGVKDHLAAEEAVVALVALALRRPVKWVEDRAEHLAARVHSREQIYDIELAASAEGRILGVRGRLLFDAGAYSGNHGVGTALYSASQLPGPYDFSHYRLEVLGVVTNKAPSAAYRGYGGPEATFVIEGLVDALAREAGLDPAEVRRRNLIPPAAFPYTNAAGLDYDVADHPQVLERALRMAGYEEERRRERSVHDGRRRGVGVACVIHRGGFGPSLPAVQAGMRYGGFESAHVRMDQAGRVVLLTGLSTQGQGVDTALAQICAERLGIDPERDVAVVSGDTQTTPYSPVGAIASRGAAVGGSAVARAADALAERLRRAAGVLLAVEPDRVELAGRYARVAAEPERELPLERVAAALQRGELAAAGLEPGLEAMATYEAPGETTSYGAHVAVVEVEPALGRVRVERYVAVHDCGTLINAAIAAGQIRGAVVQGLGGALLEELAYDDEGRLLASTLFDYRLPGPADVPEIELDFLETPTPLTLTGARGAGEIGANGPGAAVANAVADALGRAPRRLPLTPERVWSLLASEA